MDEIILYCAGCNIKVATVKKGAMKMKSGAVLICDSCDWKRKASDLSNKTKQSKPADMPDFFKDIFGGKI